MCEHVRARTSMYELNVSRPEETRLTKRRNTDVTRVNTAENRIRVSRVERKIAIQNTVPSYAVLPLAKRETISGFKTGVNDTTARTMRRGDTERGHWYTREFNESHNRRSHVPGSTRTRILPLDCSQRDGHRATVGPERNIENSWAHSRSRRWRLETAESEKLKTGLPGNSSVPRTP